MIEIDLETIEETAEKVVDKDCAKEILLVNNESYCSKILELADGYRCSYHYHNIKKETFKILRGTVLMKFNEDYRLMQVGDFIEINPGDIHSFTGLEASLILESSTHHEDSDSIRLTKSGKVPDEEFKELIEKYLPTKKFSEL